MPIQHTTTILFLFAASACMTAEPTDDADSVYETDGAIDEDISSEMIEFDMPVVAEKAGHRILATDFNIDILSGCHTDHKLDWSCASNRDGEHAHFKHKMRVGNNDVEVADNGGTFNGECVSLVKAATKSNVVTADWRPGANVFHGLAKGTAIATFPGGRYSGHTAILLKYIEDHGKVIGIRIADQNWLGRTVKRHLIRKGGSGVSNADNYFAVLVP